MELEPEVRRRSPDRPVGYGKKVKIPEAERRLYGSSSSNTHPPGARAKAIIVFSLIIVAALVASGFLYTYLVPEKGNTPEEVFLTMVGAINEADAEALVMCSVIRFADEATIEDEISELEVLWENDGQYSITVHSYVRLTGKVSVQIQQTFNELRNHTEATYSVDVRDCCAIVANCTVYSNGNANTQEMPFPFVKIGADWYLAFFPMPEGQSLISYPE